MNIERMLYTCMCHTEYILPGMPAQQCGTNESICIHGTWKWPTHLTSQEANHPMIEDKQLAKAVPDLLFKTLLLKQKEDADVTV